MRKPISYAATAVVAACIGGAIGVATALPDDPAPAAQVATDNNVAQGMPPIRTGPTPSELFIDGGAVEGVQRDGNEFTCAKTYTAVSLVINGTMTYYGRMIRTSLTPNAFEVTYKGHNESRALILTGEGGQKFPVPVPDTARPWVNVGADVQRTMEIMLNNVPGGKVTSAVSCADSHGG